MNEFKDSVKQEISNPYCMRVIAWKGVVAGTIFALGLTFLFNLLTLGIGLSLYTRSPEGQIALTVLGFVWMLIGGFVVLFLSGWVTGKMASTDYPLAKCDGIFQGFIMWTIFLVSSLVILGISKVSASVLLSNLTSLDLVLSQASGTNEVGYATLCVFLIFLTGAVGACVGAYFGIKHTQERGQ